MSVSIEDLIVGLKNARLEYMAKVGALNAAIAALEGDTALDPTGPLIADPSGAILDGQPGLRDGLAAPDGKAQKDPPPPPKAVAGTRRVWPDERKAEIVRLAEGVGVAEASRQTGAHATMIREWRRKGHGRSDIPGENLNGNVTPAPEPRPDRAEGQGQPDRAPMAGKGAMVPSGIKPRIDEDAARRAAFADPESLG